MAKICIFEVSGKVIDTNSEEFSLYENIFEDDTETLNVFYNYDENNDDFDFFLGKNSQILSDKITEGLHDIIEKLYYTSVEERNFQIHNSHPIKLSLQSGNYLQASLDRVSNSSDSPLNIADFVSNGSNVKISIEIKPENDVNKSQLKYQNLTIQG